MRTTYNQSDFIPEVNWISGAFKLFGETWIGRGREWASGGIKPGTAMVFPQVIQGSRDFNNAKYALVRALSERWAGLEPTIENSLQFTQLLTDFSFPATLAPYALNDVNITRKQYGLRNPTVEELDLFRKYVRLILSKGQLTRILHSKVSSVGATSFVFGDHFRKKASEWLFKTPTNLKLLASKISKWDVSWMEDMKFLPLYTQGTRKHAVKNHLESGLPVPDKERNYIRTENILNHSYKLTAVNFFHPVDQRLLCYDIRSMYACPVLPNLVNQVVNNFVTAGLKQFDCFRYTGEVDLSRKLRDKIKPGGVLISLDKSKFGDTFCPKLIAIFVEELQTVGFIPEVIAIVKEMLEWPTFFRTVERDNQIPLQNRSFSPVRESERFQSTFKSGNGLVSCMGQLIGGFDAVLKAKALLGDALNLETFLQNQYRDLFMHNKGDDTLWWFGGRFKHLKDDWSSSLHSDNVEQFPVYLGYLYKQDGSVTTDITRWLVNTWCHERSMKTKKAPRAGFRARYELYQNNPFFLDAFDLTCQVMREFLSFDLRDFMSGADPLGVNSDFKDLNNEEREFMANPDLAYYKDGLLERVRPELFDMFFTGTNPEVFDFVLRS